MGIFRLFGANKNDAKVAKYEYKSKKLEQKEKKERERLAPAFAVSQFAFDNVDHIKNQLNELVEQTKNLINASKDTSSDKKTITKNKKEIKENLSYLYLSKDFFEYLYNLEKGSSLTNKEVLFVVKFRPYFDGIKVLTEKPKSDDSVLGMFKEVGSTFKEMFVGDSSYYDKQLEKYKDSIDKHLIINIVPLIDSFAKAINPDYAAEEEVVEENPTITCSKCGAVIPASSKFCPECGEKVALKKFCPECGAKLNGDEKFCPECGHKL